LLRPYESIKKSKKSSLK